LLLILKNFNILFLVLKMTRMTSNLATDLKRQEQDGLCIFKHSTLSVIGFQLPKLNFENFDTCFTLEMHYINAFGFT